MVAAGGVSSDLTCSEAGVAFCSAILACSISLVFVHGLFDRWRRKSEENVESHGDLTRRPSTDRFFAFLSPCS